MPRPMSLGKAAALAESITQRHPFVYGNKRTAAIYMVAYLLEKLGYKLEAEQKKLEEFVVRMPDEPLNRRTWRSDSRITPGRADLLSQGETGTLSRPGSVE